MRSVRYNISELTIQSSPKFGTETGKRRHTETRSINSTFVTGERFIPTFLLVSKTHIRMSCIICVYFIPTLYPWGCTTQDRREVRKRIRWRRSQRISVLYFKDLSVSFIPPLTLNLDTQRLRMTVGGGVRNKCIVMKVEVQVETQELYTARDTIGKVFVTH